MTIIQLFFDPIFNAIHVSWPKIRASHESDFLVRMSTPIKRDDTYTWHAGAT